MRSPRSIHQRTVRAKRLTPALILVSGAVGLSVLSLLGPSAASAAEAPVGLGTVASYSVLGGQAVTNTGPSLLGADLGVSPGTAITGFPPGLALGAIHAADAAAAQAQSDLVLAYNDTASRAPTSSIAGDLVGQTLTAGVFNSSGPIAVSGTLTLDGQGDPNSLFVFQVASTLITATASHISVINGAQACHVYWQVASSATLGTASTFEGTIMALTSITVTTGTLVHGRALARNGQVSLDDNTFTAPDCTQPVSSSASSSAPAPTTPAPNSSAAAASSAAASASSASAAAASASAAAARSAAAAAAQSRSQAAVLALASSSGGTTVLAATGTRPILPQLGLAGLMLTMGGIAVVWARRPQRVAIRRRH
jgi:hypothetical protein